MRYALRKFIKRTFCAYAVKVQADDGWTTSHWAWTEAEALEWMRAYPAWADVAIYKFGLFARYGELAAWRHAD